MKKVFLFTTIIILASFFLSCSEEEEAYYRFSSQDNKRLLPYTEGQVLKFYNQNNEERTFTIRAVSIWKKEQYAVGMGFFTSSAAYYFYYDKKEIYFVDSKIVVLPVPSHIYFKRWPLNTELAKQNTYTEYPSKFSGVISHFSWNGDYLSIDYEQKKIEMFVNERTYKNVFVLNSGNDTIIKFIRANGDILYRDVNVFYYDEMEGIIGFDDLNGNKWRLSN
jgi:hypothetical protein